MTLEDLLHFTLHCHRTCTTKNVKDFCVTFATTQEHFDRVVSSGRQVYTLVPKGKIFLPKDIAVLARVRPLEVDDPKNLFILFHNFVNRREPMPCTIWPEKCVVHPSACIAAEGMRWMRIGGELTKMKHMGTVEMMEGVEVGAFTVIHRGTIDNTIIGENVKIGSNCSIGHNCIIGKDTMITSGVNIAGSVTIGKRCWIGVGTSVRDNISICDRVRIGHGSVITKSITESGTYFGNPAKRRGEYDGRI